MLQIVTLKEKHFQYLQEKYFIRNGVIAMKKRISQTNIQVKQDMYKALLRLMGDKAFFFHFCFRYHFRGECFQNVVL